MTKIAIWAALYPIVAHIGVHESKVFIPIAYLAILILFYVNFSQIKSWILKAFLSAVVMAVVILVITLGKEYFIIQSIPVLILLVFIFLFSKSLMFGNTPIITKFATCVDGKSLSLDKKKYTRSITMVWLCGFTYLAFQNIFSAMWLSVEDWSWISNTGSYIFISLIMLSEFIYRNKKFSQDKISFKTFLVRLSRCQLK